MAVKDIFKISFKTFFNPRAWLGYDQLKANTVVIWSIVKNAITPDTPEREESFEEAMTRLHLTEPAILDLKKTYFLYAILLAMIGIVTILCSFYFLIHHFTITGFLIGLAVTAFSFSQAFRFHFWYFQLKHRKLGCTFKEWCHGKPFPHERGPS